MFSNFNVPVFRVFRLPLILIVIAALVCLQAPAFAVARPAARPSCCCREAR